MQSLKRRPLRGQHGFTLVELVTVLALLGIVSAVAFSRFGGSDVFEARVQQQGLLSYLRLAQQVALAHQGQGSRLTLVRSGAQQWQLTISSGAQSREYPVNLPANVSYTSQNSSASLSTGQRLQLDYDALGNLVALSAPASESLNRSLALTIGSQPLCIAPTGYAYASSCP